MKFITLKTLNGEKVKGTSSELENVKMRVDKGDVFISKRRTDDRGEYYHSDATGNEIFLDRRDIIELSKLGVFFILEG